MTTTQMEDYAATLMTYIPFGHELSQFAVDTESLLKYALHLTHYYDIVNIGQQKKESHSEMREHGHPMV